MTMARASRRSGRDSLVSLRHALRATGISTGRRTGRPQEMDRVSTARTFANSTRSPPALRWFRKQARIRRSARVSST